MSKPDPSEPNDERQEIEELKAADAKEVHRAVREEGEEEVNRPAASLLWSGLAAGFAINASLLAEAALHASIGDTPWRTLVVSLGYPIGFVIVILGRQRGAGGGAGRRGGARRPAFPQVRRVVPRAKTMA